jgi:hypothetical protein
MLYRGTNIHKNKDQVQENEQRVYGKIEETYNKCAYRRHRYKKEKLGTDIRGLLIGG